MSWGFITKRAKLIHLPSYFVIIAKILNPHQKYMARCLELAVMGKGNTKTNPLVGCVIVLNDEIIAEGYHQEYGAAHAEVNAFNQIIDKAKLKEATVYVNLEPCSHSGKTPACTNLFEKYSCKKLVIGMLDPNPKVSGSGVKKVKECGIEVETRILEEECTSLNRAFIHSITHQKPYIIAKWAQSADHYISKTNEQTAISNNLINLVTQQWRREFDAYLIGKRTLEIDKPSLNLRELGGNQPIRCVIGNDISLDNLFFNIPSKTFLFTNKHKTVSSKIELVKLSELDQILDFLYEQATGTLVVEGGAYTIQSFLNEGLVNELRIITNPKLQIMKGVAAPNFDKSKFTLQTTESYRGETIDYYLLK
jgi:diaminohydroxyphosphoribosylaminopyrimidine deaminase/5-amino-6-(5-phosphoribosylamino)uracil reductase